MTPDRNGLENYLALETTLEVLMFASVVRRQLSSVRVSDTMYTRENETR